MEEEKYLKVTLIDKIIKVDVNTTFEEMVGMFSSLVVSIEKEWDLNEENMIEIVKGANRVMREKDITLSEDEKENVLQQLKDLLKETKGD